MSAVVGRGRGGDRLRNLRKLSSFGNFNQRLEENELKKRKINCS
jgi:hypothetical protein